MLNTLPIYVFITALAMYVGVKKLLKILQMHLNITISCVASTIKLIDYVTFMFLCLVTGTSTSRVDASCR